MRKLSFSALRRFYAQARKGQFSPGSYLYLRGILDKDVHLIVSGSVELLEEDTLEAAIGPTAGRGGTVGGEGFAWAAARALDSVQVLTMPADDWASLLGYSAHGTVRDRLERMRGSLPGRAAAGGSPRAQFIILKRIGSGGSGTVYQGVMDGRPVAIKLIHSRLLEEPTVQERLMREMRIGTSLAHPNLVRYYGLVQQPSGVHIVMELLSGRTLHEQLEKDAVCDPAFVLEFGRQCATGLDHLHKNKLIHRDVKPMNLFLCQDGCLKILDYGISKGEGHDTVTHSHLVMGSPPYMAPEHLAGRSHPAQDQYCLGLILFEMLAGQLPAPEGFSELVYHRIHEEHPGLDSFCPQYGRQPAAVLARMLHREPEKRFSTCSEALQALERAFSGAGSPAPRPATEAQEVRVPTVQRLRSELGQLREEKFLLQELSLTTDPEVFGRLAARLLGAQDVRLQAEAVSGGETLAIPIGALGFLVVEQPGDRALLNVVAALAAGTRLLGQKAGLCEP